jgi:hypothetical protein
VMHSTCHVGGGHADRCDSSRVVTGRGCSLARLSSCVSTLPMRQRELGVRHIEFVSPTRREGLRRVEANVDLTRRALNGTIRGVDNGRPWQVRSLRVRRHEGRSAAWSLSKWPNDGSFGLHARDAP